MSNKLSNMNPTLPRRTDKSTHTFRMAEIRRAIAADALAVADVHVRAWQVGYRGMLPQDHLDGLSAPARAARYDFDLTLPDGPVTWVAVDAEGAIGGLATIGRCRDEELADHGEVWAFYVDPVRWGGGLARELIEAMREELRSNNFRDAVLWVMEANSRARRFYERQGWRADGNRRTETIGISTVNEVRYRCGLADALPSPTRRMRP
jgi:GNAT superfamily N-acetyltransferase